MIINSIWNTTITPIVLSGNDLRILKYNKKYHSGKILFGVVNGLAIIWLSLLPKISGS